MKMTIERARQLLGPEYATLSDQEVRELMNHSYGLAQIVVDDYRAKQALERPRADNRQGAA